MRSIGLLCSSSITRVKAKSTLRSGAELGRERPGCVSPRGAPQVAQNRVPGVTGEAQRAHAAPDPGAVSRRPQCGQKGRALSIFPEQKGQVPWPGDAPGAPITSVAALDTWPPRNGAAVALPPVGTGAAAPLAARAGVEAELGLPRGFPQSMQNCEPGSLARPQKAQVVTVREGSRAIKYGLTIYWAIVRGAN
jgi:hypothetical protein